MKENNNERRKKTITVTIIGIIAILIVLITATYAYFSARSEATSQPITTAKVDLLVEIPDGVEHITNIKPTIWDTKDMANNNDNTDIVQIPITVTNNSTIDVKYFLRLSANKLSLSEGTDVDGVALEGGELKDIKYKLYDVTTGNEVNINEPVSEGDFTNPTKEQVIVNKKEIKAVNTEGYIHNYKLYVYIEETGDKQNKLQGLEFDVIINGDTRAPEEKFADIILASNPVQEDYEFTADSDDRGLFKLKENPNIYFFKGSTTNETINKDYEMKNYVQFGTYTKEVKNQVYYNGLSVKQQIVAQKGAPILWRIVRINEDKSVTLIAEHNIGDTWHVWNSNGIADYEGSTIEETVDDWYNETFDNLEEDCEECQKNRELANLIKDTEFCNDRQDLTSSGSAVYTRLWKNNGNTPPEPTLKCARSEDIVTAKAGLISADEMVYAGALYLYVVTNNTTYLDNKTSFWTISLVNSTIACPWDRFFLDLGNRNVTDTDKAAARPVITIKADVPFSYNKDSNESPGTEQNPWIIG